MDKRKVLVFSFAGIAVVTIVGVVGYPHYERWRAKQDALVELNALLNKAPTPHPLTSALRSAPSVIAYRLEERRDGNRREYVPRQDGKKLSPPEQTRLADAVDKVDFDPRMQKACAFVPGVEFRFMAGSDAVALRVCFHCNDLAFFGSGDKASSTVDFGRVKGELQEIAKMAFPDILESKR